MENYYLGIDVSKKKLDLCLRKSGKDIRIGIIPNEMHAIMEWIQDEAEKNAFSLEKLIVCAEHTGQYTYQLVCASKILQVRLCLEDAARIKYANGLSRGKSDKADAHKIAAYAERYCDVLNMYKQPVEEIKQLKQLYADRSLLVADRAKYKAQLKDQKDCMNTSIFKNKVSIFKNLIKQFDGCIEKLEQQMRAIICHSSLMYRQYISLTDIDGVGQYMAIKMIIETEAFTQFDFNPRKFCCHAGVAPFSYTSGSSQCTKARVSNRADKSIKYMLHMCALVNIRIKGSPLKAYYDRKVAEGKNKMIVLNAIRAKLVFIMFAVIKNDSVYSRSYQNNLVIS
jgi:Transposase and inactivated derivatives